MKKILLFCGAILLSAASVNASVSCYTDSLGNTSCTGYDSNGNYVNIDSYTDSLGNTSTTGYIGDISWKYIYDGVYWR